jgi:hypothetical protein
MAALYKAVNVGRARVRGILTLQNALVTSTHLSFRDLMASASAVAS